jgi:pyridoxamine-phosphate oxidase
MTQPVIPPSLFVEWLDAARASEPNDPNAMALATVDADGCPDVRMVLLKDVDARGFTFYSNQESAKGEQLWANPSAALLFHWKSLRRQVRVRGPVEPVSMEEADAYFASRARESRIGAWASDQSRPLTDRGWRNRRRGLMATRCRGRSAGPVGGSSRCRWSSGAIGRSACMTACASSGRPWIRTGAATACGPEPALTMSLSAPQAP